MRSGDQLLADIVAATTDAARLVEADTSDSSPSRC